MRRRHPYLFYQDLRSIVFVSAALSLLALSLCTQAYAHKRPPKRALHAQVGPDRVAMLLSLELAPGPKAKLLIARHDINRDGKLAPLERQQLARELLPLALKGMQLEVPGERPKVGTPQLKLQADGEGRLQLLALVVYTLPALKADQSRALIVRLAAASGTLPLDVQISARDGVTLRRPVRGALTRPHKLAAGASLKVVVALDSKP